MVTDENKARLLQDLKMRLQAHYGERLAEVVLFGSVARGEATEESDVDVLVVLRGSVDRYAESAPSLTSWTISWRPTRSLSRRWCSPKKNTSQPTGLSFTLSDPKGCPCEK